MEIAELGEQLKQKRVESGRTIASVAAEAGLSVPYIANLENGRGNPTLAAVNRLAEALGLRLSIIDTPESRLLEVMTQLKGSPLNERDRQRLQDVTTLIAGAISPDTSR
ncbi:helix-turn-helix domain-containing protein [Paractinoplanes lichenicola]|uniref:Helix-turn-helix transcriptional regulator n=1 Tax=Paractinoplanes lichenicola TaxID=2802976 RepID=A0ABS1VYM1_9ACTN|nr:helix-turn-helix transcriptional regulator [Actinoplanes lichenicola]MBL7259574.1 helix-turn-helix transcriptional regulator [Actinoplanes lichenicola]